MVALAQQRTQQLVEHRYFERFILAVIVLNAVVLGVDTLNGLSPALKNGLLWIDHTCIKIFVAEIILKLFAYRLSFFRSAWNIFDFLVISLSLLPAESSLSVLRSLRIIRALRLVSQISSLRRVVDALAMSVPGMLSTAALILLFYYIFSVIGVQLFGSDYPQWFGHLGRAAFSLFQIMTLESWSMAIVRPIMQQYPYAWIYFVFFILISAFILLNFLIGIVVDAIVHLRQEKKEESLSHQLGRIDHRLECIEKTLINHRSDAKKKN